MKPSTRQWFARGLRLSIVVGLASAAYHAWTVYSKYAEDVEQWFNLRMVVECAARLDDETLNQRKGAVGNNINVGDICADGKDFWTSPEEIADIRKGVTGRFEPQSKPFNGIGTLMAGLFGTIAAILATTIVLGAVGAARWVWGAKS